MIGRPADEAAILIYSLDCYVDKIRTIKMVRTFSAQTIILAALRAPVQPNEMGFQAFAKRACSSYIQQVHAVIPMCEVALHPRRRVVGESNFVDDQGTCENLS